MNDYAVMQVSKTLPDQFGQHRKLKKGKGNQQSLLVGRTRISLKRDNRDFIEVAFN